MSTLCCKTPKCGMILKIFDQNVTWIKTEKFSKTKPSIHSASVGVIFRPIYTCTYMKITNNVILSHFVRRKTNLFGWAVGSKYCFSFHCCPCKNVWIQISAKQTASDAGTYNRTCFRSQTISSRRLLSPCSLINFQLLLIAHNIKEKSPLCYPLIELQNMFYIYFRFCYIT